MAAYPGEDYDLDPDEYAQPEWQEGGRRTPLVIGLAAGVVLVFSAVIWNTYRGGFRSDGAELPVITTPLQPFRQAAGAAPGDGNGSAGVASKASAQLNSAVLSPPGNGASDENREIVLLPPGELAGGEAEAAPVSGGGFVPAGAPAPSTKVVETVIAPPNPVNAEPAEAASAPEAAPAPAPSVFQLGGPFQAQLAALRSRDAADAEWEKAAAKFDALSGATHRVVRADLGAKGVYYRLRVDGFADRGTARAFCEQLKSAGQPCIVSAK